MKQRNFVSLVLGLLICSMSAGQAKAGGGKEVGNGGDLDAIRFFTIGERVAERLLLAPALSVSEETIRQFAKSVRSTRVIPVDYRISGPDSLPRAAINQPDHGRILFDRRIFGLADRRPEDLVSLVVHEYLGVSRLEKSDAYALSHQLIGDLEITLDQTEETFADLVRSESGNSVPEGGSWKSRSLPLYQFQLRNTLGTTIAHGDFKLSFEYGNDRDGDPFRPRKIVVTSENLSGSFGHRVTAKVRMDGEITASEAQSHVILARTVHLTLQIDSPLQSSETVLTFRILGNGSVIGLQAE